MGLLLGRSIAFTSARDEKPWWAASVGALAGSVFLRGSNLHADALFLWRRYRQSWLGLGSWSQWHFSVAPYSL